MLNYKKFPVFENLVNGSLTNMSTGLSVSIHLMELGATRYIADAAYIRYIADARPTRYIVDVCA
jgi:hypothetical protein